MDNTDVLEETRKMNIPNFFIIGAPKCGTTALSAYLWEHPNVFISEPNEPYYFDTDFSHTKKRDLGEYLSLFSKADPILQKAIGEASVSYLFSNCAANEILHFNPNSKFIVMLRNPVDLVHSLHSERVFNGVENILDFETAWRTEAERKNGKKIPFSCFDKKELMYSEWGMLGDQVQRLFGSIKREKIKVIIFDDFIVDTRKIYEEVLDFLNINSDGRILFPKINESKRIVWPQLQQLFAYLYPKVTSIKKSLGFTKGWFGINRKLLTLNSKTALKSSISSSLRSELMTFYRDDVLKLSKLLERDLSCWVYPK